MKISKSITTMAFAGLLLVAPERLAAAGSPFYDGFETYPAGMAINGTNGWGASLNTVVVTNTAAYQGTNSVMMPPSTTLSNLVSSTERSNVWYDFYTTNSLAMPANAVNAADVNSNMTVQLFVENTHGYPVVWHPVSNAWLVCSNDYWLTRTTNFNTNAWMRFTVCANFNKTNAAVFLNGHLLLEQVRFINTNLTNSSYFKMDGGSSVTSYFDEVSVGYTPPATLTVDADNDGKADVDEIQTYGNIDTIRRLWITSVATNVTLGAVGGGSVTQPGTNYFSVPWTMVSTTLQWTADSGYYATNLLLNGASVAFTGKNSGIASYDFTNTLADATLTMAFARKYTNMMSAVPIGGHGGVCGTITAPADVYPDGDVTYTLMPGIAYSVTSLKSNGTQVATFGGCLTETNTMVTHVQNDLTVVGEFTYTATRYVPKDYQTITNAMANSYAGDTIVVSNGYLPTSGVVLSNDVTLVCTNLNLTGGLTVEADSRSVLSGCSNLVVGSTTNNGLLVVSNGTVNLGTLVMGSSATVQVFNATLLVADGVTNSGSFIMRRLWLTAAETNQTDGGVGGGWQTQPTTNHFDIPSWTLATTNFHWSASNGFYAAEVLTNEGSVGSFTGFKTNYASYTYSNFNNSADVTVTAAFKRKPTITATPVTVGGPGGGGTITASTNEVYPGESVTFTLAPAIAYGVTALTNGAQVATFGGSLVTNTHTVTDVQSNLNVQGVFTYTAQRRVPGDYDTIDAARAAALSGDTIIVANRSTEGGLTLSNMTLIATNTTVSGGITVTTGTLASCVGLILGSTTNTGLLVVSNGTVNLGSLIISEGATVQVYNAISFIANGVTYSGSFTLDHSSSLGMTPSLTPQTPPFSDDFERYSTTPPTVMAQMGHFGWSASDVSIQVQGAVYKQGSNAVVMPEGTALLNSMAPAASSNIWVDWYYREAGRIEESLVYVPQYTNLTALMFINTNGYVTVWDAAQSAFHVCSTDVLGIPVSKLSTSDWPRITVNLNYNTKKAAVFKDGKLLVQQLRFINTNLTYCAAVEWNAGAVGSTYLDALNVWTNSTPVTCLDADHDGTSDADEIDRHGDVFTWPVGSVFTIR